MPFLFTEPYMARFFAGTECPPAVKIPVADTTSWAMFPAFNRVYDKTFLCRTQGLKHAPLPIKPDQFPVFAKPITNLLGMGIGSFRAASAKDLESYKPGHFWMELLEGPHISTDVAAVKGRARWFAHTRGFPIDNGRFSHWEKLAEAPEGLADMLAAWTARHLEGYTGILNFETIGGRIIECHLRMSVEFIPLNGAGWLDAVVRLYRDAAWSFADNDPPRFMVPSFTTWGRHSVDTDALADIERMPGVRFVFPTINDGLPELGNPPNGYRRGVVVANTLEQGMAARDRLAASIVPA
jgi:hypothetical protein